ncbi:DUF6056 family protein [uncultured Succiniclasticum sp.]|uniref:DUF3329 domain-containing protein n=1 Tax=uncultured Succiniclasticum sp. TaxID=1500547 RepID=UPI0025DC2689|nr:DUF6056 family protein [uncultured Succiniclasticum sp.]
MSVSKHNLSVLTAVFLFFYLLNYLMPMTFGDDYLYSFIWQGKPMFVPLTEEAIRCSSVVDVIHSQWSHYFTWSGRVVSHTLAQLLLWCGKEFFNVCNACVSSVLVLEIYWCVHKGNASGDLKPGMICLILFALWFFIPSFSSSFLWLVGSCNYLWVTTLLCGFLIPYIRKYYCFKEKFFDNGWFSYVFFFFGVIAGCSNENSCLWIIVLLLAFIHFSKKESAVDSWLYTGIAGLILGYAVLLFAPGNYARLLSVHGSNWFTMDKFLANLRVFVEVLIWQFLLCFFCLSSLLKLHRSIRNYTESMMKANLQKDILLVKVFCIISLAMSGIMVFSPEFPLRSAFPGTVLLIMAVGILLRIQKEYGIELVQHQVKVFFAYVGVISFIITLGVTLHFLYEHRIWNTMIVSHVSSCRIKNDKEKVLCVKRFKTTGRITDFMSGYHTFENNLSEDANSWENVAFARYYGLKGIRMLSTTEEK